MAWTQVWPVLILLPPRPGNSFRWINGLGGRGGGGEGGAIEVRMGGGDQVVEGCGGNDGGCVWEVNKVERWNWWVMWRRGGEWWSWC